MEELLDRPRSLKVIRALMRKEPLTMRQFTEASEHVPLHARSLREEMLELDLITVEEKTGFGSTGYMEIRLTPLGRAIGEHWIEIERLVEAAKAGVANKR